MWKKTTSCWMILVARAASASARTGLLASFLFRVVFLLMAAFLLTGCDRHSRQVTFNGITMGSSYVVKVVPGDGQTLPPGLEQDIFRVLDGIDKAMTTWDDQSELNRLNATPVGTAMTLSPDLFAVLEISAGIHRRSGGLFDPTVGPLVDLWGFGPDFTGDKVPSHEAIAAVLPRIGYDGLHLDRENMTATRARDVRLDLSAIAQGYGAEKVAEHLRQQGLTDFLVDISGEMVLSGHNQEGKPWQVAVEVPSDGERQIQRIVSLSGKAIATSGNYRNYFVRDGVLYSHTIDPRTGMPIRHELASATVITGSAAEADGLATALMVMGPERAMAFAEEQELPVLLLVKYDDHIEERSSRAFAPYLEESAP